MSTDDKSIKGYKAFHENWQCQGFQYEVGKTYEHDGRVDVCKSGFHSCELAIDVMRYYDITTAKFAKVTASGKQDSIRGDSKIASAKITIDAELSLPQFVNAAVKSLMAFCQKKGDDTSHASSGAGTKHASSGDDTSHASSGAYTSHASSGDYTRHASSGAYTKHASSGAYTSHASSGDDTSHASSGDDTSHASSGDDTSHASSGDDTSHASSGDYTRHASSGAYTRHASSGTYTKHASSGDDTKHASSGAYTRHASSGTGTKHASSGDDTSHAANGKNSVISTSGISSRAKGCIGTWISLAEFKNGKCVGFATGCIGQDGLKPDTWYVARNGELVEEALVKAAA